MIRFLEPMLYIDDQAQVPVCLCENAAASATRRRASAAAVKETRYDAGRAERVLRGGRRPPETAAAGASAAAGGHGDPEEIWRCKRRIAELTPMLTQMNELAELTAHYYDRGYYRNEKYTV